MSFNNARKNNSKWTTKLFLFSCFKHELLILRFYIISKGHFEFLDIRKGQLFFFFGVYYCPNSCMSLPSLNKSKTGLLKLLISTNSLKIFQQERFKLNYTLLLNTKSRTFYKKYLKKKCRQIWLIFLPDGVDEDGPSESRPEYGLFQFHFFKKTHKRDKQASGYMCSMKTFSPAPCISEVKVPLLHHPENQPTVLDHGPESEG